MFILFGLIGAALGAAVAGPFGALFGLAAGAMLGHSLRNTRSDDAARPPAAAELEPAVSALARRVQALEQEVAALRAQLQRLMGSAAEPAEPIATFAPEDLTLLVPPPPVAAPPEPPPFIPPLPVKPPPAQPLSVKPVAAASASAPDTEPAAAWSAPSPRPRMPPAPPPVPLRDRLPPFISDWIFGGNTIVKVGVLILFLGLAFLLRYAAERVTVPVELRYAGVALVGAFLLGLGWRLRARADAAGGQGYGLILQGAGIGVFYLTSLAAIKLHPLLPPSLAFVFMAAVAVLGAVLAVAQNAPWLALVSIAEGFAAPVLVSTGGGNHVALFTYLAILDVGIFLMAWFRAWRALNLLGAVSTFELMPTRVSICATACTIFSSLT